MEKTVVLGTIYPDAHIVGSWLLRAGLLENGFKVVFLGALTSQEEFLDAAKETNAEAIWISSLCGSAIMDCEGFRDKCKERGLRDDLLLYIGGILTAEDQDWATVEKRFKEMGFNRVYPPGTDPRVPIAALQKDLAG